jgi:photosystem II stability/assembly factor-like uncharacterized protein
MSGQPKQRRVLKVFGRTVGSTGVAVMLIVLLAALLATSLGFVAHALGSSGTVGSQSATVSSTTVTGSTGSGSVAPTPLAQGPDQSKAPDFPISGGAQAAYGAFSAIACPTTTNCFAVGANDGGSAVASSSSNGGDTWTNLPIPSGTQPLSAISCGDGTHCVGVGKGVIASTANAGSTWALSAVPIANTTLVGANCISDTTCVAAGVTNDQYSAYSGAIVRTNDGGSTWQSASVPAGTKAVDAVTCPTTTTCIAVGDSLLVSTDGGATWSTKTTPSGFTDLRSISCSSSTQCVAIGTNPEGINDESVSAIAVETTDGGATWTNVVMPSSTPTLDQVSCPSTSICVAAGSSQSYGGAAPFYQSNDGGATWAPASTTPSQISEVAGLACPAVSHCAVVGRKNNLEAATSATSNFSTWQDTLISADAVPPNSDATS